MAAATTIPASPPASRTRVLLDLLGDRRRGALVLIVLTFLLFGSATWHCATLDSRHFLTDDLRVREFRLGELLTEGYWYPDPGCATQTVSADLYRPLTLVWVSAWWQLSSPEQRAEQRPVLLNLANLGLHAAGVVLRFLLLLQLLGGRPRSGAIAFFAAVLLAVHPIATETVATQIGAAEGLVAVCGTAALLCWHRWQCRGARLGAFGFAAWLLLALLAKENAVAIAAIAPIGSWLLLRRTWRQCASVALVAAAPVLLWVLLRLLATGAAIAVHDPMLAGHGPAAAVQTALAAVGWYDLPALLWPCRLLAFVGHQALSPPAGFGDPRVLAGLGAIAAWLLALVLTLRWDRAAAFGLLFFAVAFFPVSNLVVPIGALAATRFLYLPMTGLALAAAIGVDRLANAVQPGLRRLGVVLMVVPTAAFALTTLVEVQVWSSHAELMRTMARRMPDLYFLSNLGAALVPEAEAASAAGDQARSRVLQREALRSFTAGLAVPLPKVPGVDAVPEGLLELAWQCRMAQAIAMQRWNGDFEAARQSAMQMIELARQGAAQSIAMHGETHWLPLESEAECLLADLAEQQAQRTAGADSRAMLLDEAEQHVARARHLTPDSLDPEEPWLQIMTTRGGEAALGEAYGRAYERALPQVAQLAVAARIAIGYSRFLEHGGHHERALAVALEALVDGRVHFGGGTPFFDYGVRGMRAADVETRRLARAALQVFLERADARDATNVAAAHQLLRCGW